MRFLPIRAGFGMLKRMKSLIKTDLEEISAMLRKLMMKF